MIFEQYVEDLFKAAHPKAADIPLPLYRKSEATVNRIAQILGYRFAGERLGRAVFTTKAKES